MALGFGGTCLGAAESAPLDSLVALVQGHPLELQFHGEQMWRAGLASSHCMDLLGGYTLLLMAYNEGVDGMQRPEWPETVDCEREGIHWIRAEAVSAFQAEEFDEAIRWYQRGLEATDDPKIRASLQQGIGVSYLNQNELESAHRWFMQSLENGKELLSSISLANMSNAALMLAHNRKALEWAQLAEERLLEEFKEGMGTKEFERRMDLIFLNQTLAHIELDNLAAARAQFARLHLDGFFPGLGPSYFHAALTLAWLLDDPTPVAVHEGQFAQALLEDSVGSVAYFGPVLALLPPWREGACRGGGEDEARNRIWTALKALPAESLPPFPDPDRVGQPSGAWSAVRWGWWVSAAVLGAGLAVFILGWVGRRKEERDAQEHVVLDVPTALNLVAEALADPSVKQRKSGLLGLRRLAMDLAWGKQLQLPEHLTVREMSILNAAFKGERPKITATQLGLSAKRVYAIRSELRNKLGIPANMEFEQWIEEKRTTDQG